MKKFVCVLFAIALIAALAMTAFAATGINDYEQKVLDKLATSHVIGENGWDFSVPQEYINSAKNYFAGDGDMTEAEMEKILDYIDQGMKIVKKEADSQGFDGETYNLANMGDTARSEVLNLGKAACAEVDLQLTYVPKDNQVVITPVGSQTPVFESAPVVKTTGEDFAVTTNAIIAAVIAVLAIGAGAMFVVSKKNGLFNA